ncbi:hypothetical protein [Myceligenerans pegani]|uniref:Uncharacterized protein n=1 Tax=Myceligenerans pegani TaxID=2776917 RepID=A0ABR9MYI9_9MICO|nr:hypothetical protein [Myceligenerans sp. TRM 65318]MBE1875994.1 hypothetical protein [Myceligenerans sp. TRM 65318]MBE3018265.1 hypothetical protein [Myceligenerans sp. TRM 65318]
MTTTKFEFSLVLDRDPDPEAGGHLAEAVPYLATLEGGPGTPTLANIIIEADNFPDAVATVVWQIEAAGYLVLGLETNDTVAIEEIAIRTGRPAESVRLLAEGGSGSGGFPRPVSSGTWDLYSWTAVADWFTKHFPDQAFDIDRQATAADHLLRARHLTRTDSHRAAWARLLSV